MKRQHLEELLDRGMVMLHVDSRQPEVDVPEHLRGDPHLKLNLSYRFRPCDLEMDDQSLRVTLSFGGQPWSVQVPFSAIFSLTSHATGESLVWLEDVPAEVLANLVDMSALTGDSSVQALAHSDRAPSPDTKAKDRHAESPTLVALHGRGQAQDHSALKANKSAARIDVGNGVQQSHSSRSRSHLRLVK